MSEDEPEIRSIPVDLITVQNPRVRNKRIFQELVDSIAHLRAEETDHSKQAPWPNAL